MKTDYYTKAILTVIAVCLSWICIRDIDLVTNAMAQTGSSDAPMPVALYAQVRSDANLSTKWVPVRGEGIHDAAASYGYGYEACHLYTTIWK